MRQACLNLQHRQSHSSSGALGRAVAALPVDPEVSGAVARADRAVVLATVVLGVADLRGATGTNPACVTATRS